VRADRPDGCRHGAEATAGMAAVGFIALCLLVVHVLPLPPVGAGRFSQLCLTGVGALVTVLWARSALRARGRAVPVFALAFVTGVAVQATHQQLDQVPAVTTGLAV
jgi:hypothetical protein